MTSEHLLSIYRRVRPKARSLVVELEFPRILTRNDVFLGERSDCSVHVFGSEERVELQEPVHMGSLPVGVRDKVGIHTVPQPFLLNLHDIELVGPNALPITKDGQYVLESTLGSTNRLIDTLTETVRSGHLPFGSYLTSPEHHRDTPLMSLIGPWCTEFFHWFTDYLPRLRGLERYEEMTGERPDLLLPTERPQWMSDSLDLLKFAQDRRVPWTGGRMKVDDFVVGSVPRHTETSTNEGGYIYSPKRLRELARTLRSSIDRGVTNNRRLYVSREYAADRRVSNEAALLEVLREYGFDKVHPETMPLARQIELFASAEAILGPHGGGLLNMIYARNPIIIELFGAYQNPCFFAVAQGLSYEYATLQCEPDDKDLEVDPKLLRCLLRKVLLDQ